MNTTVRRHLSCLLAAAVACGAAGAKEDRENFDEVQAGHFENASAAVIAGRYAAGYRVVDLEVYKTSPLRFSCAYVKNTGSFYAPGAKWYYNLTKTQVDQLTQSQTIRIDDIEPYVIGGDLYFALVVRSNAGSYRKSWSYRTNATSVQQLYTHMALFKQRPIDIEQYVYSGKRYWTWASIGNTGADQRNWEYLYNYPQSQITAMLAAKKKRIYGMDRVAPGRYDLILTDHVGSTSWLYFGLTSSTTIPALIEQYGVRVYDTQVFDVAGQRYRNVLLINSSNPRDAATTHAIHTKSDGQFGWYLWEKGVGALSQRRIQYGFEPAHTITIPYLLHALRQVQFGKIKLTDEVTVNTSLSGTCPTNGNPVQETLETVLDKMMKGQTTRARAIEVRFGRAAIEATALSAGLTFTKINHTLGCTQLSPPANIMDVRGVQGLVTNLTSGWLGIWTGKFRGLMRKGIYFPVPLGSERLNDMILAEASRLGVSDAPRDAFRNTVRISWQHGTYPATPKASSSMMAWISLPYWSGLRLETRELGASLFVGGASNQIKANNAVAAGSVELLRQPIAEALATWKRYVVGSATPFGSSCTGSAGRPEQAFVGSPHVGRLLRWDLTKAAASTPVIFWLGFSDKKWGAFDLPLPLTGLGGTGCTLYTEPALPYARVTSATGFTAVAMGVPLDKSLLGLPLLSQYWVVDPAANPLGLTFTNGMKVVLGGGQ